MLQLATTTTTSNLQATDVIGVFDAYIPVIAFVLFGIALATIGLFVLRAVLRKGQSAKSGEFRNVTLMVTVPKFRFQEEVKNDERLQELQEGIATAETFFSAIAGLKAQKGLRAWLYGRTDSVALEMLAHEGLITFYVTVPKYMEDFLSQQLQAQYADANIEPVEDYNMFAPTGTVLGGYLTLKRDHVVPIKTYKEIDSDPLNAITNALSKIPDGEGAAIQLVCRSARSSWRMLGKKVVKNMQKGMTYDEAKKGGKSGWSTMWQSAEQKSQAKERMATRKMSPAEEKMLQGIDNKLSKGGLDVNIRVVVSGKTPTSAQSNLNQIMQAFSQYNIYEYGNALTASIPRNKQKLTNQFIYRIFDEKYNVIFNTEEMASLWHLPGKSTDTPNIRWMLARTAPPPPNMPTEGLQIGYNQFRGVRTDIFMSEADRRRHMYVIGKTGTGKSHFISYLAEQDIRNGKGVAVIDPHGDLAEYLLGVIPKERIDDVVYFNPSDMDRPIGLNMLEAPNESMKDFAVQEMISIFYMLFPPEMIGPMFEHNMRNFMLTLMSDNENPGTIAEIPRMISDDAFQKKWLAKVTDPVVRSFWEDEMANTSDYHKSEMMGYLVSKVGRFVENTMMRNIIGQGKSSLNFRQIMDEGKILLVNLSKGKTGDVNANLLGMIIVSKLQMAAFTRADMAEEDRKDFYCYIDEFQNFITPSIATILSEARKYRLSLILAHQYMGQLVKDGKTEIRDAVLGNVGSMMASRLGPDDVDVLGKVFAPVFADYDLMNNDKYTWNAKLIIDNAQAKPFTLKAIPRKPDNPKLAEALREISRLQYGRARDIVEREIALRSGIGAKKNTTPPPAPPSR